MKKLHLDRKTIVIGAIIAALCFLGAGWMSQAQKKKVASLKEQLAREEIRYNISVELSQVYAEVDGLKKRLIEPAQENLILDTIRESAKADFVKLDKLDPDAKVTQEGRFGIKPMQVMVTGAYEDTVKFIEKIENLNYFIQIESLNCKVKEPLTQGMLYQASGEPEDRVISTELKLVAVYVNR